MRDGAIIIKGHELILSYEFGWSGRVKNTHEWIRMEHWTSKTVEGEPKWDLTWRCNEAGANPSQCHDYWNARSALENDLDDAMKLEPYPARVGYSSQLGKNGPAMMILHNQTPGSVTTKAENKNEPYDLICGSDTNKKILDRAVSIWVNLARAPGTPVNITRETMDSINGEYFQVFILNQYFYDLFYRRTSQNSNQIFNQT